MTNANCIRQMDDYELAKFLCNLISSDNCYKCVAKDHCRFGHNGMLDWLQEEAENEQG